MDTLSILINAASQAYYTEGYMYFELSRFTVKIGVDELILSFLDDKYFQAIDENFVNIIETNNINVVSIELIDDQNIEDRVFYNDYSSLSKDMYFKIKNINKYFPNLIQFYKTYIDYGDEFCGVERYFYSIKLKSTSLENIDFVKYIANFNEFDDSSNPKFYQKFFTQESKIKDSKVLKILSTNTKVRRLGYFKILSLFFGDYKKIPASVINKKFENHCLKYEKILDENKFKKGLISETKTGISAKPYIDTANDFEFLNKINNIFHRGKPFKVYQVLQSEFSNCNNVFELSNFDKIFFLECILRNDYFYFSNLLELLFIEERIEYSRLVQFFQYKLIRRLENYKETNKFGDRTVLNHISEVLNRIKKWEKPEVYLEHIIMPRLNWMLDLGIVTGSNNNYEITEVGIKLFQHLCIWNDINTEEIISSDAFLDRFMVNLFDDCYNNGDEKNPENLNIILEKLYYYIDDSFDLFKTLAPNRVTASQAINYTKYKLYFNEKIKVGFHFIKNKLEEKEQVIFIFKYQEQYQDGYIQRKNK